MRRSRADRKTSNTGETRIRLKYTTGETRRMATDSPPLYETRTAGMKEVTRRRGYTHRPAHKTNAQCPPGQARHRSSEERQLCSDRWPSRTSGPRQPQVRPSGTRKANHGPPGVPAAASAARCPHHQPRQQRRSARRRRSWQAGPWPHSRCHRRRQQQQPRQPQPPSARRSSGCACAGGTRSPRASCRTCCRASGRCTGPSSGGTARTPWGSSPSWLRQEHQQQPPARPGCALVGPRALLRRGPATP